MQKITSFTIDHLKLQPGVYVSRKDPVGDSLITTFDIRMTSPNEEPVMNTAEVHTIEHLGATFLRNHPDFGSKTIYYGPMGCRTGFYLLTRDTLSHSQALRLVQDSLRFIADFTGEIPGTRREECGNYREHDLNGAKEAAREMLPVLERWDESRMTYAAQND